MTPPLHAGPRPHGVPSTAQRGEAARSAPTFPPTGARGVPPDAARVSFIVHVPKIPGSTTHCKWLRVQYDCVRWSVAA